MVSYGHKWIDRGVYAANSAAFRINTDFDGGVWSRLAEGDKPATPFGEHAFQACALSRSAILPGAGGAMPKRAHSRPTPAQAAAIDAENAGGGAINTGER